MGKVIFKGLDEDYLIKSLLRTGLFTDKIVSIFDSSAFCKFVLKNSTFCNNNKTQHYGLISHRIVSHKNSIRTFKIPHPHAYARLCKEIGNSWDKIANVIENNWNQQKVNILHVRKMSSNPYCIFKMDYSSKIGEENEYKLKHIVGNRYIAKADISSFFPSVYTHSIVWVAVGRKKAFDTRNDENKWYNKLDTTIRNAQNKESIGLPVGPHTSNIISDLVLSEVDKKLLEAGFCFIRYIDDYECYTKSKEEAEKFVVVLSDEIAKIRLNLNRNKTEIIELPFALETFWLHKIKSFIFTKKDKAKIIFDDKRYDEIVHYLDFVVDISKRVNNSAPIRYAIKFLRGSKFSPKAFSVFEQYVQHLVFLYPYLSDFAYDIYISKKHYPKNTDFIDKMLSLGIEKKLYATISRAIYAVLKFNLTSKKIEDSIEKIIESGDCIAIMALMIYCRKNNISLDPIVKFSELIIKSGQTDEYWVLVYELYRKNNIHRDILKDYHGYQSFKQLKDGKVTFVNKSLVTNT